MPNRDDETEGRFVTRAVTRPAVEVDCSKWVDASAGWTFGEFVTKSEIRPAVEVDCRDWAAEPAVWLELVVSFGAAADLAAVEALTLKLIRAAHEAAPELGLTYDTARSKVTDGDVVIALTPNNPAGAEARIGDVIRRIREALANTRELALAYAGLRWMGSPGKPEPRINPAVPARG